MELLTVKVDSLRAHPGNYNIHPDEQVSELEKSLDQFLQFKNIVITPDNIILAGHGLVEAAKRKGIATLDAYVFEGTHTQEKALLLADNATPFLALPDIDKLNALLESLPSLDEIPGVTNDWMAEFHPIEWDGDQRSGNPPWERMSINGHNEDFVQLRFGEIVCNIPANIYHDVLSVASNTEDVASLFVRVFREGFNF